MEMKCLLLVLLCALISRTCARSARAIGIIEPKVVTYCPAQKIVPPETPVNEDDFPGEDYEKVLAEKGEEFIKAMDVLKFETDAALRDEDNEEATEQPACQYSRSCAVVKSIVNYWKVSSQADPSCWVVQPLIWTTCISSSVPDWGCSSAEVKEVGYSCVQEYTRHTVWVYCEDRTFRVTSVNVPSGCTAMQYFCDPATDPSM